MNQKYNIAVAGATGAAASLSAAWFMVLITLGRVGTSLTGVPSINFCWPATTIGSPLNAALQILILLLFWTEECQIKGSKLNDFLNLFFQY